MASLLDDVREVAGGWRWGRRPLTPRSAEPWAPVREPGQFPTAWARTPVAVAIRSGFLRYGMKPLVWTETDPHVAGLDNLEGLRSPVVFVSNHSSHMDTPLVLCSLPKAWQERTAVAAAADYFFDVRWRAATTALAFNTFPIERTGARRATGTAQDLLHEGWNLLVFPEGTRSRDGWMGRFRHGVARMCVDENLPVVPVAIRGAFAAMPRGAAWPRKGRFPISVRFGPPVRPVPGDDFRSFSRRIQHDLARVWDEDATDWWTSLRHEAEGSTRLPTGPEGPRWRRVWEATKPIARTRPPRTWRRP